ncbi:hypothetical protein [Pseudoxanthomonas wuyuanensis]
MFRYRQTLAVACAVASIAACGERSKAPAAVPAASSPVADNDQRKVILHAEEVFTATVAMAPREAGSAHDRFPASYRPTLLFDAAPTEVVCVLDMSQPLSELRPGGTGRISGRCRDDVTLPQDELGFVIQEGGRDVGRGTVELR